MRRVIAALLFCIVLLTACGDEEDAMPVSNEPVLSEQADTMDIFGVEFKSIGPVCGYITTDDYVEIHPYYNSDSHIRVEKILLSDRGFWKTVESSVSESAVIQEKENYSLITLKDGTTYGYKESGDGYAIVAKSVELPSYYVKAVMDRL